MPETIRNYPDSPKKNENEKLSRVVPEKKSILEQVWNSLRNLWKTILPWQNKVENKKAQKTEKKVSEVQEFFANVRALFYWVDIEKWVVINSEEDLKKVRDIFLPIIDLNHTWVEYKKWDFIVYNKEKWTIDFYPSDVKSKKWYSDTPDWIIPIERKNPKLNPDDFNIDDLDKIDSNDKLWNNVSKALWNFIKKLWPIKSWPNSCWRAVHMILKKFWIEKTPRWHWNQWFNLLKNDSRFELVNVNSLSEIPAWWILTFSWKWKINWKPHWSSMNQRYWHVEVKWSNNLFYSFYWSKNPGGSAKAPQFHNNFQKWKEATGFQWVFIPKRKK